MEPLLAPNQSIDVKSLKFPLLLSPKIDGIRAWNPSPVKSDLGLCSRRLMVFPNASANAKFDHPALRGADGEFTLGDMTASDLCRKTGGFLQALDREASDLSWNLFDSIRHPGLAFKERLVDLAEMLAKLPKHLRKDVLQVTQHPVGSLEELLHWEEVYLGMGFEGVMLRDPDARYKFARATLNEGIIFKLKRFTDAEARVLGWYEQKHNANQAETDARGFAKRSTHKAGKVLKGTLGGLECVFVNGPLSGVEFRVGGGFTDDLRNELWADPASMLNKIATVKFFAHGVKDKPRHTQFKCFRPKFDGGAGLTGGIGQPASTRSSRSPRKTSWRRCVSVARTP
jgi:DNA ligase-1